MRYRSLKIQTPPAVEPVTLAEAKAHCRIDTSTEDAYVSALITAAREWVESYMNETLVATQYVMKLDAFPDEIELPNPPMITSGTATAVTITYTENDTGSTATLSTSEYRVDRDSVPGVIRPLYAETWPSHLLDYNAVQVTWWAGRGGDASTVPQRVRAAMLMLVAMWFEKRMAADSMSMSEIPFGVKALLDSVKWGSYT